MVYSMPPDTNEKEKVIGGLFDMGQLLWFGIGAALYVICVLLTFRFFFVVTFFIWLPFIFVGAYFAIKKKENMPLPKYLWLKHKYKKKIKYYVNSGFHTELTFSVPDRDKVR